MSPFEVSIPGDNDFATVYEFDAIILTVAGLYLLPGIEPLAFGSFILNGDKSVFCKSKVVSLPWALSTLQSRSFDGFYFARLFLRSLYLDFKPP